MAKKSILWKTIKEFNPVRENGSLLVLCVKVDNKTIVETATFNNSKNEFETMNLAEILYSPGEPGKTTYVKTGIFTELEKVSTWCYLDEFLAGMNL